MKCKYATFRFLSIFFKVYNWLYNFSYYFSHVRSEIFLTEKNIQNGWKRIILMIEVGLFVGDWSWILIR